MVNKCVQAASHSCTSACAWRLPGACCSSAAVAAPTSNTAAPHVCSARCTRISFHSTTTISSIQHTIIKVAGRLCTRHRAGIRNSTIGEQKRVNAHSTKTKDECVHIMNNLNLPYPKQIGAVHPCLIDKGSLSSRSEKSVHANLVCACTTQINALSMDVLLPVTSNASSTCARTELTERQPQTRIDCDKHDQCEH